MDMTLDFAIQHALEAVHRSDLCEECRSEHQQLANWLQELKELKAQLADNPDGCTPVVRCKSCKFVGWSKKQKAFYCKRHWTMHKVRERDYCSYGRRTEMKANHEHSR